MWQREFPTNKIGKFGRGSQKGKGQSDFSDWPLFNAGNDLRSHTLGACSTIGPAGLNFRVRDGNGWIPRGKITDKSEQLLAISSWLLA